MKSPIQSKTIWFNVILGMVDMIVIGAPDQLAAFLSADQIGLIVFALSIIQTGGNIYLRYITTEAIRE
jgi:hypothetical protein